MFESKLGGSSIKWIDYNKENIEKYKDDDNMLQHARVTHDCFGWMVVKGNTLVAYCGCQGDRIVALEVMPKFRKQHWGTKLLKKAKSNGCKELSVEKNNRPAIGMYFKNGFYIYGSNKKMLFMRLRESKEK